MFHDQPIKPLDKAVYWIEYVIRHNGAHHLKTAGNKLNWIQFLLLDVLFVLIIVLLAFLTLLLYTIKKIFKLCVRSKKSSSDIDDDKKDK